jgi:uncharacterized delta-60 repeat protein
MPDQPTPDTLPDSRPALTRRALLNATPTAAAIGMSATLLPSALAAASPSLGPTSTPDSLSLDIAFAPDLVDAFATTRAILTVGASQLLIGGEFGRIGTDFYTNIALLDDDGTPSASFTPYLERPLQANGILALAARGDAFLAGGSIDGISDRSAPDEDDWTFTQVTFPLVTVTTDATMAPVTTGNYGTVAGIAVDGAGRVVVAGGFGSVGGVTRRNLARLLANGDVDEDFDANLDSTLSFGGTTLLAVAVQPDGRIVIGGELEDVGGVERYGAARLWPNGDLDASFDPNTPYQNVYALAIDGQGGILIGGEFANVAGGDLDEDGGIDRVALARYHANGTLDASFDANLDASEFPEVRAITLQSDGRILIGGTFTMVDGVTRRGIARLHPNGALDPTFTDQNVHLAPDPFDDWRRARVDVIAIDQSGRVVIGGDFERVSEVSRRGIARLA